MKLMAFLLTMIFSISFANASCDDSHKSADKKMTKTRTVASEAGKAKVQVAGMSCGACVKKLKGEVAKIKDTGGVNIMVEKNLVTIDYSDSSLDGKGITKLQGEIEKAVVAAGFEVSTKS